MRGTHNLEEKEVRIMKVKKLAAFLLCLTVTVSTLTGAIYTQAANTAAVLYVSDSGADTADGQTPKPAWC